MRNKFRDSFRRHGLATVLACVAFTVAIGSQSAYALDAFASLDQNQKASAERLCAPAHFLQSAQAYRDCLLEKLDNALNSTNEHFSALAGMPLDEQHAIQRYCTSSGPYNSAAYADCVSAQQLELETQAQPAPDQTPQHDEDTPQPSILESLIATLSELQPKHWAGVAAFALLLAIVGLGAARRRARHRTRHRSRRRSNARLSSSRRNHNRGTQITADRNNHTPLTGDQQGFPIETKDPDLRVAPPEIQERVAETSINLDQPLPKDRSRFADWLNTLPDEEQQESAIELLLYWVAYADKRFDPASKTRVFQLHDPDNEDLIKRWAFKQDATALADAMQYLKLNTDREQREQIINLLMALLVFEKALTPIQNNLLRFIADTFGIVKPLLNRLYYQAFGEAMPALPRPDKMIWWAKVDSDKALRWDARALALQPDEIRYRVALGLPLEGTLGSTPVEASYQRAIARCAQKQASRLGERERSLLELRQEKFSMARNALMGIAT